LVAGEQSRRDPSEQGRSSAPSEGVNPDRFVRISSIPHAPSSLLFNFLATRGAPWHGVGPDRYDVSLPAVCAERASSNRQPLRPMPEMPDSPSFVSGFRVRSYELDGLGHVNHAVYLNYLEQARFDALASGGFPLHVMEAEGWAVHVVRIEVDYRSECRFEDQLLVTTRVLELRNSSMTLGQKIHCLRGPARPVPPLLGPIGTRPELPADPALAVEARIVAVWVGPSGRPIRIPGEVRSSLAE